MIPDEERTQFEQILKKLNELDLRLDDFEIRLMKIEHSMERQKGFIGGVSLMISLIGFGTMAVIYYLGGRR